MKRISAWHRRWLSILRSVLVLTLWTSLIAGVAVSPTTRAKDSKVVILVYHRFADRAADSMTVRTENFEAHLKFLRDNAYKFRTLRDVVHWLRDPDFVLPPKVVVLTVDDGHRSVYEVLMPIARREGIPITLFVYPSAIANATYALTWEQLRELRATGLFDIQSHTWWHPNFNTERKRMAPEEFRRFALTQFIHSRESIQQETGGQVDLLAWPYGIYDDQLMAMAEEAGYIAAFTLQAREVRRDDRLLALPRFLIVDAITPVVLRRLLGEGKAHDEAASSTP